MRTIWLYGMPSYNDWIMRVDWLGKQNSTGPLINRDTTKSWAWFCQTVYIPNVRTFVQTVMFLSVSTVKVRITIVIGSSHWVKTIVMWTLVIEIPVILIAAPLDVVTKITFLFHLFPVLSWNIRYSILNRTPGNPRYCHFYRNGLFWFIIKMNDYIKQ